LSPGARRWASRAAIALACVVGALILVILGVFGSGYLRPFYLPSEGMAPTLEKNDHLLARMSGAKDLRRGDVILLRVGEAIYVKRLAGLPGDTIGLREGIVILNGRPVPQRLLGEERRTDFTGPQTVRRLAERFPGEASEHHIYDSEPSMVDEAEERKVPPGRVFVLGDNRDRSADSRVPRTQMGVDLLPVEDVRGYALFYSWPPAKMGLKVNR